MTGKDPKDPKDPKDRQSPEDPQDSQDLQADPFPPNWLLDAEYDPNEHLMSLKGKDYLDVQQRLIWFLRDQRYLIAHGHATATHLIHTELVELDREVGWAHFRTTVRDVLGNESVMYGSEAKTDFPDYIEKASTKSLGRALLALGYGAAFAPEMDEGERIVDSPVDRQRGATSSYGQRSGPRPLQRTPRDPEMVVTPGPKAPPPDGVDPVTGEWDPLRDETIKRAMHSKLGITTRGDFVSLVESFRVLMVGGGGARAWSQASLLAEIDRKAALDKTPVVEAKAANSERQRALAKAKEEAAQPDALVKMDAHHGDGRH